MMWPAGHKRAVDLVKSALKNDSLPHAFLVIGPPQIGKRMLAFAVAQALNCSADEAPCFECDICRRIKELKFADVSLVDINSAQVLEEGQKQHFEISVEQIRKIQHSVSLPPYEGKNKVYIIDGAENMSASAANCFLKTLEEPNDKCYFFLISSYEDMILPTVASRCQVIRLKTLAAQQVETLLRERCGLEGGKAKLLARWSGGRPGWALDAFTDEDVTVQRAKKLDSIMEVINGGMDERLRYSAWLAGEWAKNKETVLDVTALWLEVWRDISLHKIKLSSEVINTDRKEQINNIADCIDIITVKEFIEKIIEIEKALRINAAPQLALDMLMLSLPDIKEGCL